MHQCKAMHILTIMKFPLDIKAAMLIKFFEVVVI